MKKDPLGKTKQIGALRDQMTKDLNVYGIYSSPELKNLPDVVDYADQRRVENERQLEAIKCVLAGYIFNENVVLEGTNADGTRVIQVSHFDVMMKAMNMFLSAMNMQNKIWGLYSAPTSANGDQPLPSPKNVAASLITEMQRLARKEKLALPTSGSRPADNGTPNPDLRGTVKG